MSEVKKPVAKTRGKPPKKSTGKGQTQHKKNDAKKTAQKQPATTNPLDQALTMVAKKFVKAGGTKLLLKVFPYLLFGYFGNKIAYAYRVTEAPDFFNKLMGSLSNLGVAFEHILPSFHPMDLIIGAVIGVGMRLVVYMKSKNAKKFRKGEEYGSARCGIPVLCFLLLVQSASFAFYSELFWADQCSLPGRRVGRSSCKECVCIQVSHRHAQQIYDLMAAR